MVTIEHFHTLAIDALLRLLADDGSVGAREAIVERYFWILAGAAIVCEVISEAIESEPT
jgi:hypothetical protein